MFTMYMYKFTQFCLLTWILVALAWLDHTRMVHPSTCEVTLAHGGKIACMRAGRGTASRPISVQSSPVVPVTQSPVAFPLRLVRRNLGVDFTENTENPQLLSQPVDELASVSNPDTMSAADILHLGSDQAERAFLISLDRRSLLFPH